MAYYSYSKNDFTKVSKNVNNEVALNVQLLLQLYAIQSPSGFEEGMSDFITAYVNRNHRNVRVVKDASGNLLITKGALSPGESYPCLVAHMDEVHSYSANKMIIKADDFVFGFNTKTGERTGTGADDKNGILVALEMLNYFPKLKIFFSVGEEKGCVGSNAVNLEFFSDVAYVLQCDRRGTSNLITKTNGVTVMSDEMLHEILDICEEYGYSEETGTSTDVGALIKRGIGVSGCNISCGYFSEHTADELTHLPSLENCMNLVYHFIKMLGCTRYGHTPKSTYSSSYGSSYGYYGNYGNYGNYGGSRTYQGSGSSYNRSKIENTRTERTLPLYEHEEEDVSAGGGTDSCVNCRRNYRCETCPCAVG